MANRFDVRGQYESDSYSRRNQGLSNVYNLIGTAADVATTFMKLDAQNQQLQADKDFTAWKNSEETQKTLDSLKYDTTERPFTMDGDTYMVDGQPYTLTSNDHVEGSVIRTSTAKDATQAYEDTKAYLDNYLADSGILEGKGSDYVKTFTDKFDIWKAERLGEKYNDTLEALHQQNAEMITAKVKDIQGRMGNGTSGTEFEQSLSSMIGDEKPVFEIPEITVHMDEVGVDEQTTEEYAKQRMERDFAIARNLQFYTLRGEHSEAEAKSMVEKSFVSDALSFDLNGASQTLDEDIRNTPYFDPTLAVERSVDAFSKSPLLQGRELTQRELDVARSDYTDLVNQRVAVFEGQVASSVAPALDSISKLNEKGAYFGTAELEDALQGAYSSIGTTEDVAEQYLNSSTKSLINTFESIALQNESAKMAYDASLVLNGTDEDVLKYAADNGIETDSPTQARVAVYNRLPMEQKAYIHDNLYTKEVEYTFSLPSANSTNYMLSLYSKGRPTLSFLNEKEGLEYHSGVLETGANELVSAQRQLAFLEGLKEYSEDFTDSDVNDYIRLLMESDPNWNGYFSTIAEDSKSLGVDLSQPSTVDTSIKYLEARIDDISNSLEQSSDYISKNGGDPTYVKLTKEEFKTQSKGDPSVVAYVDAMKAPYETFKQSLAEFNQNEWVANEMAIEKFQYTGIADETLQRQMALMDTEDPNEAVSALKKRNSTLQKANGGQEPYSQELDSLKAELSNYAASAVESILVEKGAWDIGLGYTTDNSIYTGAIDALYKEYVGDAQDGMSYTDKATAIMQAMVEKGDADKDNVQSSYYTAIKTVGDMVSQSKDVELLRLKSLDSSAHTKGSNEANSRLSTMKEAKTKEQKENDTKSTNEASMMLATGMSEDDAYQMLASQYGSQTAKDAVASASLASYDSNGTYRISGFSTFDQLQGKKVDRLATSVIDELTKDMPDLTKSSVSKRYGQTLTNLLIEESKKGQNADYEKLISDFKADVTRAQVDVIAKAYGIAASDLASDNVSNVKASGKFKAKNMALDNFGFIQDYADGNLCMTMYGSMIPNYEDMSDDMKQLYMTLNDTSKGKDNAEKYSLAMAYNIYTNSDYFKNGDIADMSLDSVRETIAGLSNDPMGRDLAGVMVLASIEYGGYKAVSSLADTRTYNYWLDMGIANVNGVANSQDIFYTDNGYILKANMMNGDTVYCVPTMDNGRFTSDGWTFYSDAQCTKPIYAGLQSSLAGLSDSQLGDLNLQTAVSKGVYPLVTYEQFSKSYLSDTALYRDKDALESKRSELETKVSAVLRDSGEVVTGTLEELRNRYNAYEIDFTGGAGFSATDDIKDMLRRNTRMMMASDSTNGYPSLYAINIADGSYKAQKCEYLNYESKDGFTLTSKTTGLSYEMTKEGLKPKLTKQVSMDDESIYWNRANQIVSRSGGRVSIQDAYNAVLECYQGFDKPVVYMDYNGSKQVYYPAIYDYIRKGWYL